MPARIFLTAALGLALSFVVFGLIRNWERRDLDKKTADVVHEQLEKLQVSMLRSIEVLYSVAALYSAEGRIEAGVFRKFVEGALARQSELLALSWNPVVRNEGRREFEASSGVSILELDGIGKLSPAGGRSEFVPVAVIEPILGNERAIGYDLASDAVRREALEKARDSGKPVATAPVQLAQGAKNEAGLLVVMPAFSGPRPQSVIERRERISGFTVAVFRVSDLVRDAFAEFERRGIEVELRDLSANSARIRSSHRGTIPPANSAELIFAEHRWQVSYAARGSGMVGAQSWAALAGCLAFTSMATAYLCLGWRRARDIEVANVRLEAEAVERRKAEDVAKNASKAKSDFLANMSHEIRTPLNAILGYAQLMQKDLHLGLDHRDSVGGIFSSGRHLLGLINEVLDLSKIEAGMMELHAVDFSLAAFRRQIEATFRPLCAQKRIGLRVRLDEDSVWLRGDEGKLRQIIINLVGNAVKFTNTGEVFLGIARGNSENWEFEVIDTGMGITDEECPHIFEPFHQGKGSQHQGGTGLGLAIARRQVELMGGDLKFESERGIGTRFFFSIPLEAARNRPESTVETEIASPVDAFPSIQLPPELCHRMMMAAELHSATALKACLSELREAGSEGAQLADAIRQLMRGYDMEAIQRLVAQMSGGAGFQHDLK